MNEDHAVSRTCIAADGKFTAGTHGDVISASSGQHRRVDTTERDNGENKKGANIEHGNSKLGAEQCLKVR